MAKKTLADILAEKDEAGLLSDLKPMPARVSTEEQRILQKFEEVNSFIDKHGRLPGSLSEGEKANPAEKMLHLALTGIVDNPEATGLLASRDRHAILSKRPPTLPPLTSLDEIIASGDELINTDADEIFSFRNAPQPKAKAEQKALRRPSKDFESFKHLFETCASDLKAGRRKTIEFKNEQEIMAGEFFILNGAMLYVAEVNDPHFRNGKPNARLRLIFDNGTEGDNLLRSLSAELYKDGPAGRGRRVTAADDGPLFTGQPDVEYRPSQAYEAMRTAQLLDIDRVTGEIYIVRSLSHDPAITALNGRLFKIGFTTGSVDDRILSAKDDPTFLMAAVHPVKAYRVVNMSSLKIENLLHRFFGDARLNIEIIDRFGKPCRPREWFSVSLETVQRAIEMLIDGSIVDYQYDRQTGRIVQIPR